jgi:hypothetical protein
MPPQQAYGLLDFADDVLGLGAHGKSLSWSFQFLA